MSPPPFLYRLIGGTNPYISRINIQVKSLHMIFQATLQNLYQFLILSSNDRESGVRVASGSREDNNRYHNDDHDRALEFVRTAIPGRWADDWEASHSFSLFLTVSGTNVT